VRTYSDPDRHPQYSYLPPSLATDPFYDEPITKRRLQGLAFMIRAAHPEYEARALDIIGRTDLQTCFKVLEQASARVADRACVSRLAAAAADRHGPVAADIAASLEHALFRRKLSRLRTVVLDREQRYLLALLQGLPDRDAIYAAIRRDFPGEKPRERV